MNFGRSIDTIGGAERCQTWQSQEIFPRQEGSLCGENGNEKDSRNLRAWLLLTAAIVAVAVARQAPNEEASVRATVATYLHGLKFNDVASFRKAFYPQAKLFFVRKNGESGQLTQQQWYQGFAANAGKEERGELRIAAVDITGKAASVKVIETYPDSTYTDYVSLLKLGDEWKIVNKVFTFEERPA